MSTDFAGADTIIQATAAGKDYIIIVGIFLLIPLFCITITEATIKTQYCSSIELSREESAQCEQSRKSKTNAQYIASLLYGFIFIVLGYLLFYVGLATLSVGRACVAGGLATLIYACYNHASLLTKGAQASIFGLIIASFIFLPYFTKGQLLN